MEKTYQMYLKSAHKPVEVVLELYKMITSLADVNTLLKHCLYLFHNKADLLEYDTDFFALLLSVVTMKNYSISITSASARETRQNLKELFHLTDDEHIELLTRYILYLLHY
jgi:hypothetical protein